MNRRHREMFRLLRSQADAAPRSPGAQGNDRLQPLFLSAQEVRMRLIKIAVAVAFLAASPSVFAQNAGDVLSPPANGAIDEEQDEGNPRTGLLGLIGLIGLLGRFRPEPNIHVDARRSPPR